MFVRSVLFKVCSQSGIGVNRIIAFRIRYTKIYYTNCWKLMLLLFFHYRENTAQHNYQFFMDPRLLTRLM